MIQTLLRFKKKQKQRWYNCLLMLWIKRKHGQIILRVWLDAGVPYTIATDQGPEDADLGPTVWGRMGRAHFDRMVGLQDAGAEPLDILRAATLTGAEAYRLGGDRGSVEVGKRADLLVLGSNPLEDIANVRDILHVMQRGMLIDRDALPVNPVLDYDPELPWPY